MYCKHKDELYRVGNNGKQHYTYCRYAVNIRIALFQLHGNTHVQSYAAVHYQIQDSRISFQKKQQHTREHTPRIEHPTNRERNDK